MPIRVVLADDQPRGLESLGELVASEPDIVVVASCRTGEEALAALRLYLASDIYESERRESLRGIESRFRSRSMTGRLRRAMSAHRACSSRSPSGPEAIGVA